MEEDEASDPVDVGLLGADGIVLAADSIAYDIEELLLGRFWRGFGGESIEKPFDNDGVLAYNRVAAEQSYNDRLLICLFGIRRKSCRLINH
ncbi:MAG: hypothetical protein ACUVR4_15540, partial [Anaerolineae bacterium]